MSRISMRWALHHPWRWAQAVWWHIAIAVLLALKAVLVTAGLWDITALSRYWPLVLVAASTMCLASAIALTDERLQTATMLTLLGVGIWRAATYGMLWAADTSSNVDLLAKSFAIHWVLLAIVALRWPTISTRSALIVSAEASREREPVRAVG